MILKLDMPYDPSLGFIGVSKGNETRVSKDSNPTLITAPITIAKSWEAYKYSSVEEQMKKMWYLSTVGSDSSIGKKKSCHWDMMELEPSTEKQVLMISRMESKLLLTQKLRGKWWLPETGGGVGTLVTGS